MRYPAPAALARPPRARRFAGPCPYVAIISFYLAFSAGCASAKAEPSKSKTAGAAANASKLGPQPYCGVYSLCRAMRSLGRHVNFADLLKPKYIGSKRGSSIAELIEAAEDFGYYAEPVARMNCRMLRNADCPIILHVKFDLGSKDYNHWILFLGTQGDKARICDGNAPLALVPFDDISARWDGQALLISDSPIDPTWVLVDAIGSFLVFVGIAALAIALLLLVQKKWFARSEKPIWKRYLSSWAGQAVVLVVIALLLIEGYGVFHGERFLSYQPAIAAIQDYHLATFLPKIKANEIAALTNIDNVTFVDVRLSEDYAKGHIKGAVNIPPGSSRETCKKVLEKLDQKSRIAIYSYSSGCAYGETIARKIMSIGFSKIILFEDGWDGWERFVGSSGQ